MYKAGSGLGEWVFLNLGYASVFVAPLALSWLETQVHKFARWRKSQEAMSSPSGEEGAVSFGLLLPFIETEMFVKHLKTNNQSLLSPTA